MVDIGTGDGLFAYQCARRNPNKFYIGIDANPRPLEKISEKIHRKPEKGGAANLLFLQAAVEDLPAELSCTADEIHIHFPWGSLLQSIILADRAVLSNLRRLCTPEALLEIVIGTDPDRDRAEMNRLKLPVLSHSYVDSTLAPAFKDAGFEIIERGDSSPGNWPIVQTSWAKRLEGSAKRSLTYIIARAVQ